MKTDELRHALDDLAGDVPPVDDLLRVVTRKAARDRVRSRGVVVAVIVSVIGVATFGITRQSEGTRHVTVRNPSNPTGAGVADLAWTSVRAPETDIRRIVTANGHTYAVGSYGYAASIQELNPDGLATTGYRDDISHQQARVTDLIGLDGALVAVGGDEHGAAAWRSTDGGDTWAQVPVMPTPGPALPADVTSQGPSQLAAISRVFPIAGGLEAIGLPAYPGTEGPCVQSVWTSTDGTKFTIAPRGIACSGSDAADGPAGIVSLDSPNAFVAGSPHARLIATDATVERIASDDNGYVAVGSAGGAAESEAAIWWSPDGTTWTRVLTAPAPADPNYRQAALTGVVHTAAGWVAVGWQLHPGGNPAVTDATLWTSSDGQHWSESTRDNGTFEQFARAETIGVTANGFAVSGVDNITGTGVPNSGDPIRQDQVLWLGSSGPQAAPVGIVDGTMDEVGGPAPGIAKGIEGSLTATAADGRTSTIPVAADGTFSSQLAPGTYTIVGQSPLYNGGDDTCGARYLGGDELGDTFVVRTGKLIHVEVVCSIR